VCSSDLTNFDLRKLQEKKVKGLIYSSLTSYKEMKTMKGEQEHGATLTFGTRGNDRVFIRLYEKKFELASKLKLSVEDVLEEYGIYNRYELELGKEVNPYVFERYLNGESLADIAIDILLSKLEIYEEIETDTGTTRQAFKEWYDIFAHWKKVKISAPTDEISIERTMRWIETQVAPTLLMLKKLVGIKWLLRWLIYCMRNVELTPQKEKQIQFEKMLLEKRQNKAFLYYDQKMKER
jgi:phage replication initiation protein